MKECEEIRKLLDSNYFRLSISIDDNGKASWFIFYCNLNFKDYFSFENKPLLTSTYNTLDDVKKLLEKFEKEKNLEKIEEFKCNKEIYIYFSIYSLKLKKIMNLSFLTLMNLICIFSIYNLFFIKNVKVSILIFSLTILMSCITIISDKILDEKTEEIKNKLKDELLLKHIKKLGLEFVKRLK